MICELCHTLFTNLWLRQKLNLHSSALSYKILRKQTCPFCVRSATRRTPPLICILGKGSLNFSRTLLNVFYFCSSFFYIEYAAANILHKVLYPWYISNILLKISWVMQQLTSCTKFYIPDIFLTYCWIFNNHIHYDHTAFLVK